MLFSTVFRLAKSMFKTGVSKTQQARFNLEIRSHTLNHRTWFLFSDHEMALSACFFSSFFRQSQCLKIGVSKAQQARFNVEIPSEILNHRTWFLFSDHEMDLSACFFQQFFVWQSQCLKIGLSKAQQARFNLEIRSHTLNHRTWFLFSDHEMALFA